MADKLLFNGESFTSVTGTEYTVLNFVRAGTQGEIYRVKSRDGNIYALKIYFFSIAKAKHLYNDIENLVTKWKKPGAGFVWPREIAVFSNTFGYIMNYVDLSKFKGIFEDDCILERDLAVKVCLNIAQSMQALHLNGLCYKDLSPNNFMFNPANGQIVLFDCDNINPRGTKSTVSGTPGYRAPEIVLLKNYPNEFSDIYSMATIFFKVWMGHDIAPMEGSVFYSRFFGIMEAGGSESELYLYGTNPVFIFDESNRTNSLDESDEFQFGKILLWRHFMPEDLKQLLTETFTVGLFRPDLRAADGRWVDCFKEIGKRIVACKACGSKNVGGIDFCIDCHERLV